MPRSKYVQGEKPAPSSTLELPLALGRLQGGTEVLQVPTLSLVHKVEEFPKHRDWQCAKGHLRHKQPNAKSAHFKRRQEKFYILESFTTLKSGNKIFAFTLPQLSQHTHMREGQVSFIVNALCQKYLKFLEFFEIYLHIYNSMYHRGDWNINMKACYMIHNSQDMELDAH